MTLGANILRIRNEKNLSAQKLGQLVGVSKQMIYQYEKDESVPGKEILDKIATSLGLSVADLYAGKSPLHSEVSAVGKKILDLDVWEELRTNNQELRKTYETFKLEIDRLWKERNEFSEERRKYLVMLDRLTIAVESGNSHKAQGSLGV